MKLIRSALLVSTATLITGATAAAHTSYMLPSVFNTSEGELVTVQCSFTEDFPMPEIAVKSDDYHVVLPDGSREDFDTKTDLRQLVVLENGLESDGTYRLTTGVRLGRKSKRAMVDGEWVPVFGPDAEVPEDATAVKTAQTETVADVYVSKGAPTWDALAPIGRLAFVPKTHPNEIFSGEAFDIAVTFDGAPLADHEMSVYRSGGNYEEPQFGIDQMTDEAGEVSFTLDEPGIYMIMTRHRADAPAGAETDERGYTTSLTFEVMK
ncbi:MAG: DUF4198 domain-containing protein [Pseudomonadota bacterium]